MFWKYRFIFPQNFDFKSTLTFYSFFLQSILNFCVRRVQIKPKTQNLLNNFHQILWDFGSKEKNLYGNIYDIGAIFLWARKDFLYKFRRQNNFVGTASFISLESLGL